MGLFSRFSVQGPQYIAPLAYRNSIRACDEVMASRFAAPQPA
jgi:hypothetical protein